jgi:hypothetical protein
MEKILSWLNDFKSFFSSEVSKISNAQAELAAVRAELASAQGLIAIHEGTITDLKGHLAIAESATTTAQGRVTTLEAELATEKSRATEALAAQGLEAGRLPAGSTSDAGAKTVAQQIEALRKQLTASTDPKEKYKLSAQIRELLSAKN